MNEGWICPKCGKCLAPWVRECDCVQADLSKAKEMSDPYLYFYPYQPFFLRFPFTGDPIPPPPLPYPQRTSLTEDPIPPSSFTACRKIPIE